MYPSLRFAQKGDQPDDHSDLREAQLSRDWGFTDKGTKRSDRDINYSSHQLLFASVVLILCTYMCVCRILRTNFCSVLEEDDIITYLEMKNIPISTIWTKHEYLLTNICARRPTSSGLQRSTLSKLRTKFQYDNIPLHFWLQIILFTFVWCFLSNRNSAT